MQTACQTHLKTCALAPMLKDLRAMRNDDIEAHVNETWAEIIEDADSSGDGLDYDGPLTWGFM